MLGAFQTLYSCHQPTNIPSGPTRTLKMECHTHEGTSHLPKHNPSCDMLNLYDRSTLIARIHDQLWIEEVLGPQQRKRWYNGEYIFNVSSNAIDEHCEKRYAR